MSRLRLAIALCFGLSTGVALAQSQGPAVPTQSFGAADAGAPPSSAPPDAAPPDAAPAPAQSGAPPAAAAVPPNPYVVPPAAREPVPANPYVVPPRPADTMEREAEATPKKDEEIDWRLRYDWGLGAGVGFGGSDGGGFLGVLGSTLIPGYRLSLERRVGPRTWLLLNARFSNNVDEFPLRDDSDPPLRRTIEVATNSIGGLLGLRHAVVTGIVEVSLFATVGGSYLWIGGQRPAPYESFDGIGSSMLAGSKIKSFEGLTGVAVERELIEALAVRLSTGVAGFALSEIVEVDNTNEATRRIRRSSGGFQLQLSPAIELRFYF